MGNTHSQAASKCIQGKLEDARLHLSKEPHVYPSATGLENGNSFSQLKVVFPKGTEFNVYD